MLLVNQANDHGEITGSGVADSVAHDAKDRIEGSVDWNGDIHIDGGRLNSDFGRLGAYQRRSGALHGVGADDAGRSHRRVSWRLAARGGVYR